MKKLLEKNVGEIDLRPISYNDKMFCVKTKE